jgi:RNA polymerase sigma-70 factor (ECF subfamily)
MSEPEVTDGGETFIRFEQAVLPHLSAAWNLARWLMRDRNDAEDIVQQSCLRACRGFATFRGGDARAWLLTIVRNACYSELSRRRRQRGETGGGRALESLDDADLPAPPGVGDPQLTLLRRLDHEALAGAVEDLPDVFREAFVLREMEGLSYQEIAEVAGVPVGTVMSRLARARQRLQDALAGKISVVDEGA